MADAGAGAALRSGVTTLTEIADFLDRFLAADRFDERGGVYRGTTRAVRRIGVALDQWPGIGEWTRAERLDAVFLHRLRDLPPEAFAEEVGVIAYHLPFDERMTIGWNPRLAGVLGLESPEPLGDKDGRPVGMIGTAAGSYAAFRRQVAEVFGGEEEARAGKRDPLAKVAVVGAMSDALVREAAERGATVYVTGQWRRPAHRAVSETGIGVIAVGHRRCEAWGIRALAGVVRERWAGLEVIVAPPEDTKVTR